MTKIGFWSENTEPIEVLSLLEKVKLSRWHVVMKEHLVSKELNLQGRSVIALALWNKQVDAPFNSHQCQQDFWQSIRHSLSSHTPEGAITRWADFSSLALVLARKKARPTQLKNIILNEAYESIHPVALQKLSQLDLKNAAKLAVKLQNQGSDELRAQAAFTIGQMALILNSSGKKREMKFYVGALDEILRNPHQVQMVKEAALQALSLIPDSQSLSIIERVTHENEGVLAESAFFYLDEASNIIPQSIKFEALFGGKSVVGVPKNDKKSSLNIYNTLIASEIKSKKVQIKRQGL